MVRSHSCYISRHKYSKLEKDICVGKVLLKDLLQYNKSLENIWLPQTGLEVTEQWDTEEILGHASSFNSKPLNVLSQLTYTRVLSDFTTLNDTDFPFNVQVCKTLISLPQKKSSTDYFKQSIWCLWVFISITLFQ